MIRRGECTVRPLRTGFASFAGKLDFRFHLFAADLQHRIDEKIDGTEIGQWIDHKVAAAT